MKRVLFAVAAIALAFSASAEAKWTKSDKGDFIEITQDGGLTLGYSQNSGVKILTVDGFAFKDLNRNGIYEQDEVYVFYTHNHYNDFREYLNYYGGWGEIFGNETGGGEFSSETNANPTAYVPTAYGTL